MEENLNNAPSVYQEEDGMDVREIILKLWNKGKLILYVTVAFAVLGFFAALFQKPVYNASCTFVPEKSSSSSSAASLSSLAAIAGINLGDMSSGTTLSPLIYPQLLQNINFNKDLMRVPLDWKKYSEPVSVPMQKANSRAKTLVIWIFLGFVLSCCTVLIYDHFKK